MRHPYYTGRKTETVPSIGSRLPGVVKPTYGKPRLAINFPHDLQSVNFVTVSKDKRSIVRFGPEKTQHIAFPGVPDAPAHDLQAKSPRRDTRDFKAAVKERAALLRLYHKARKRFSERPRLVSA